MTATDVIVVLALALAVELILLGIKRRPVKQPCNCQFIHCRKCRP